MAERARRASAVADTVGLDGRHTDPVWGTVTVLRPLESALLRTWPVRRLGLVAHAGAVATVTTQTYSRLEHSLGVLGLAARADQDDVVARAAALLHDVGHAPLSHTLEGIDGIDHHALGVERVHGLRDVLGEHGVDVEEVQATLDGRRASVVSPRPGLMTLDHLDSYVRSARAHGRPMPSPAALLRTLEVVDGAVRTTPAGARALDRLVAAEVAYHRSPLNVLAVGVVRQLVRRWDGDPDGAAIAAMTDGELVAALLTHPATRDDARLFLRDPLAWQALPASSGSSAPAGAELVEGGRSYLVRTLVTGEPVPGGVEPAPAPGPASWVVRRP